MKGCVLCSSTESLKIHLCDRHLSKVMSLFEEILEDHGGNFAYMLSSLLEIGAERKAVNAKSLQAYLNSKFSNDITFNIRTSFSRFNTTQALKKYCRDTYKRNEKHLTKPPKNSSSKASFVRWAKENRIDISCFQTRSYRRRYELTIY